jgi:hypothetical protein
MRAGNLIALGCIVPILAACERPEPRTVTLDRGLTLLERGPIDSAWGSLSRSSGFGRASVVVQGPPAFAFDTVAHWRRDDAMVVPDDPADRRRILTGPAGIGTMNFVAPSMDASELLIEMAPAYAGAPRKSRF